MTRMAEDVEEELLNGNMYVAMASSTKVALEYVDNKIALVFYTNDSCMVMDVVTNTKTDMLNLLVACTIELEKYIGNKGRR